MTARGRAASLARRGVTLIEAVLFIAVALGLIVGGPVFYQQATLAARTQETVRLFSAIVQETRGLYHGAVWQDWLDDSPASWTAGSSQIQRVLISAGAVPASSVRSETLLATPWGGDLRVHTIRMHGVPAVFINAANVPREACVRLLVGNGLSDEESTRATLNRLDFGSLEDGTVFYSATTAIADGMIGANVSSPGQYDQPQRRTFSPAQAALGCTYGVRTGALVQGANCPGVSGIVQSCSPAVPPLPGTVDMRIGFLLNP
jgi:hypothetical protein